MSLLAFKTVRGRLLALLIAIALPIACLTAVAAITTYRTVTQSIEAAQSRAAADFAVRTRVWFRGALRALLSAGSSMSVLPPDSQALCHSMADKVLGEVRGYQAIYVNLEGRSPCSARLAGGPSDAELAAVTSDLAGKPSVQIWGGVELARTRYDTVSLGGRRYLAVYAQGFANQDGQALVLADPELLDSVFNLGESEKGMIVALLDGDAVVLTRGIDPSDRSWLPRTAPRTDVPRWDGTSQSGSDRSYAARLVVEPSLFVVASFSDAAASAAKAQLFALLVVPLLTLLVLGAVYLRAIDTHCARWLRGIEAAVRARGSSSNARAPVAPGMPSDIRSVAEAFNAMIEEQEVRQRKLQAALDDNRYLVRELHHRVKNSLQVVQSYIGLTKRDYSGEARAALSDAECRVHVLSAAYRFTLAHGEIQPVRVDLFLDDVVTMISSLMRGREQSIVARTETTASLPVDRIIPLGFLIVDVVARVLRTTPQVALAITASDVDERHIDISLHSDREIEHAPPPKIFAGLVAQIEAVQTERPEGKRLGSWRVMHAA